MQALNTGIFRVKLLQEAAAGVRETSHQQRRHEAL